MKTIVSAALGLSLMIGSAALSFGAQDPAMPAKTTDSTVSKETTKTKVKGKHPKKVKSETKSTTTSTTTPPTK